MTQQLRAAAIAFAALTLITGVLYPAVVTVLGQALYPAQANGSLIEADGRVIGSTLIGQPVDAPAYFQSRPSAVGYMLGAKPGALIASGATNAGWTNAALAEQVTQRAAAIRAANGLSESDAIPTDLLFASASGLDPHISPEAALLQADRVAAARGIDAAQVRALVERHTEAPQLGIFGQPRVNVLLLNLALDTLQ